jgi:hypothetical protein
MTRWFEAHTVRRFGRFRQVEPTVVVEVAFDVIQRSNRHQSGFALRFPRIVRLRIDKSPTEIDTLANVERLHRELQYGAEYLVTAEAKPTRDGLVETAESDLETEARREPVDPEPGPRSDPGSGRSRMDHPESTSARLSCGHVRNVQSPQSLPLTVVTAHLIIQGTLQTGSAA